MLISMDKDIAALSESIGTIRKSSDEVYSILYKDTDSILSRLNNIATRLDNMADDHNEHRQMTDRNSAQIEDLKDSVSQCQIKAMQANSRLDQAAEKRSKFYYVLLLPIVLAIIPLIMDFVEIRREKTEYKTLIKRLELLERDTYGR